jgi:hypothetical protein
MTNTDEARAMPVHDGSRSDHDERLPHPDQNVLNVTQNSLCMAVNRRRGRAEPAIVDEEPGFQGRGPHGNGKR